MYYDNSKELDQIDQLQAQIEALQAQIARAKESCRCYSNWWDRKIPERPSYEALQQQVEALQRELLEWKRALCNLTPGGSEFADDHAYCAEWVRKARENQHDIIISKHRELKAAKQALDAEREKVTGLKKWRIDVTASLLRPGGAFYDDVPKHVNEMAEQLTQLQTLVRALIYSDNAPEHDRAWFALRATLDATTPATCSRIGGCLKEQGFHCCCEDGTCD